MQGNNGAMVSQVGPGGCPPGPPTDPDVRDYRIRLLGTADSLRTTCAVGLRLPSGLRSPP